jgi:esterase/lipase superfamily enzyme
MPTPLVYAVQPQPTYERLDPSRKVPAADILYITDRERFNGEPGRIEYGIGRNPSVAFGKAEVVIGDKKTWDDLKADAKSTDRLEPLKLSIGSVEEIARTPAFPFPYVMIDGRPVTEPSVQSELERVAEQFKDLIRKKLQTTPRKDIFIYVHGIHNTFSEAVYTTAELWHYFGREGVPVAYSWPAGGGGLLRGYTYDRESSEFTVTHLKAVLRLLTSMPEVDGVHIIAHSRGTDVVTTAFRALMIESHARKENPRERYRIKNMVLASPDLDIGIMLQRTASARIATGMDRLTIYASKGDKALALSEMLFGGLRRLGQAPRLELPELTLQSLEQSPEGVNIAIIEYVGKRSGDFGHNYFRTNPMVASDLVLTVRYEKSPGAENGRPLTRTGPIYWQIDDDYLRRQ